MNFLPFDKMWERIETAKDDSDMSLFMNLMYMGEMLTKCTVAGITAAIMDDRQRNRYRVVYQLVRTNGLGDWAEALNEILTGPAAQFLTIPAYNEQKELMQPVSAGNWQHDSVKLLHQCMVSYGLSIDDLPTKVDGRRWCFLFAQFRNQTRGHGAPQSAKCASICTDFERSLKLFIDNFSLFKRSWVYLHRNLSGKYRVTRFMENITPFEYLKKSASTNLPNLPDGVYIHFDNHSYVELMVSDPDAYDFFFPNGQFTEKKFELISYITEDKKEGNSSSYMTPSTDLPDSETQGTGILDVQGNVWGNLPPTQKDYIQRPALEKELFNVLSDDRHPIITLVGRGGIGKTWLALTVLHQITNQNIFDTIIWFSARDIDLLPYGPKLVKPRIYDEKDVAEEFTRLLQPSESNSKGFKALDFLAENLGKSQTGPILFVFDNFETVRNPTELYKWIDTYLRLPNKVLITTRFREFQADYHVEVLGMNEDEAEELVTVTARKLGIEGVLNEDYKHEIFLESDGHPYVIKILLGEVAKAGKLVKIERIVADSEEILKALFERTYSGLSPVAKRVFLTLCNWRSMIPQLALEAVLLRPSNEKMDVLTAIDELIRSSFVEIYTSDKDSEIFLSLPLVTMIFGKKKLAVSPMKSAIEADTQLLRSFGAVQASDILSGITPRLERLFRYIAGKILEDKDQLAIHLPMLEFIARKFPSAWIMLASLYEESGVENNLEKAKESLRNYLETPENIDTQRKVWEMLATLCARTEDWTGEVHAWVELIQIIDTQFRVISDKANRLNFLLSKQKLLLDTEEKEILVKKLIEVMEKGISEGDATDCSRIAWLYLHLDNELKAKEYIETGLKLDPYNNYIMSLAEKFNLLYI